MIVKAITLYQPYASLIAVGAKRFETRGCATNYRGPIAIHAGLKEPEHLYSRAFIDGVSNAFGWQGTDDMFWLEMRCLPRGAVIATAKIRSCYRIEDRPQWTGPEWYKVSLSTSTSGFTSEFFMMISEEEYLFGDWRQGRYAWRLDDVQPLPEPVPARGMQGLWNWEVTA